MADADVKAPEAPAATAAGAATAEAGAAGAEAAEEALAKIKVDYEVLPAVFDTMAAMKDGAPVIHDEDDSKNIPDARHNICAKFDFEVNSLLLHEKMEKRLLGLGAPDLANLRAGREALRRRLPPRD